MMLTTYFQTIQEKIDTERYIEREIKGSMAKTQQLVNLHKGCSMHSSFRVKTFKVKCWGEKQELFDPLWCSRV